MWFSFEYIFFFAHFDPFISPLFLDHFYLCPRSIFFFFFAALIFWITGILYKMEMSCSSLQPCYPLWWSLWASIKPALKGLRLDFQRLAAFSFHGWLAATLSAFFILSCSLLVSCACWCFYTSHIFQFNFLFPPLISSTHDYPAVFLPLCSVNQGSMSLCAISPLKAAHTVLWWPHADMLLGISHLCPRRGFIGKSKQSEQDAHMTEHTSGLWNRSCIRSLE